MRPSIAALFFLVPGLALAAPCDTQVTFKQGASEASYNGSIRGDEVCSYRFTAKAGQALTVWLNNRQLDSILFGENSRTLDNGWPLTLQSDGAQEIRVLQNRNAARKSRAAKSFRIRIAIKGQ